MSEVTEQEIFVRAAVTDHVATLTLNRPDRLNAVNGALSRQLNRALDSAARDPDVRVIMLTGAGRAFCAGADFKMLDRMAADTASPNAGVGRLRYGDLLRLPKPVIAAVNGACAGVGLALACCADIRVASSSALFVSPFSRLALTAEVGLGWLLPHLIGIGNSLDMLMSCRRIAPLEALAKGLVSQVYPEETFLADAHAYAAGLARAAPLALATIKRQVYRAATQDYPAALNEAMDLAEASTEHDDFREAIAAQREGREPVFTPVSETFLRPPPVSNAEN